MSDAPDTADSAEATGDFAGRTILVTGGSRGLGAACAQKLAAEGAQIIALARTQGGLEALDDGIRAAGGAPPVLVPADVCDGDALDRLGAALFERYAALDGVIHAAGGHQGLAPLAQIAPKDFEAVIALNLMSAHRLIRAMDPLLRAAAHARGVAHAVFITDGTPPDPPAFWGPYAAAKAGLTAMVGAYAAEARPDGVHAHMFTPPPMSTAVRMKAFPGDMGAVAGEGRTAAGDALADPAEVAVDVTALLRSRLD